MNAGVLNAVEKKMEQWRKLVEEDRSWQSVIQNTVAILYKSNRVHKHRVVIKYEANILSRETLYNLKNIRFWLILK